MGYKGPGTYKQKDCAECGSTTEWSLCHACNMTLGLVQDDVERLQRAAQYLVTHGGESDS